MRNFVRGGTAFAILGLFVIFIYAQTRSEATLSSAKISQVFTENEFSEIKEANYNQENNQDQENNKKSNTNVKKTVSSRKVTSSAAGAFTATAYCLKGRTAMGHGVKRGLIAADPRVLKLGSRVFISAGAYSGEYFVSDTGGGVKGREIDIWMPSCSEARRFGRRKVTINPL
jgi:3D (Asp-Asp-Asp) domain-containing protein